MGERTTKQLSRRPHRGVLAESGTYRGGRELGWLAGSDGHVVSRLDLHAGWGTSANLSGQLSVPSGPRARRSARGRLPLLSAVVSAGQGYLHWDASRPAWRQLDIACSARAIPESERRC